MNRVVLLLSLLLLQANASAASVDVCPILPSGAGVEWKHSRGSDFDVCYATRGNSKLSLFGIYLGNFPSFRPEGHEVLASGNVAGMQVTWYSPDADEDVGRYSRQTAIELGSKWPAVAHVWVNADTEADLDEALSILAKIQFRDVVLP